MNKNVNMELQSEYVIAVENLQKYCEEHTDLIPCIVDYEYPFRVDFVPDPQLSLFTEANTDENGEVNQLMVTVGLTTSVRSTLKFKMDSKTLKKLIKYAEKIAFLHYHEFRAEQGEKLKPKRAVNFRCPYCDGIIPNPHLEPNCCQECGQALDWRPEDPAPAPDEFAAGMEKLRGLVDKEATE